MLSADKTGFLKKTLLAYYLDPGVALWRAIEAGLFSDQSIEKPILDIGCGTGAFFNFLISGNNNAESAGLDSGHGKRQPIIGLDLNKEEAYHAKQSKVYDYLVIGDVRNLPFKNGIFSTIISNCVLEHVPDVEEVFAPVSRSLLNGGKIYFTVPSEYFNEYLIAANFFKKTGMTALKQIYIKKKNRQLQHVNIYSIDKWKKILEKSNLNIITYSYYVPQKTAVMWDFLFSFTRFGIWKFDIGNFLYVLDRCLQMLGINIQTVLSPLFYKILKKYLQADAKEGAGLFIAAKKTSTEK